MAVLTLKFLYVKITPTSESNLLWYSDNGSIKLQRNNDKDIQNWIWEIFPIDGESTYSFRNFSSGGKRLGLENSSESDGIKWSIESEITSN